MQDRYRELPESVPQVSFDVRLGEQVDYTDFDYAGYCDYAEGRGLCGEALEDTSISFKAESVADGGYKAYYSLTDKEIAISCMKNPYTMRSSREINKFLFHETEHRIDHDSGALSRYQAAVASLFDKLAPVGTPLVLIGGALGVMELTDTAETSRAATIFASSGLSVSALSKIIGRANPAEIRAQESSKNELNIIAKRPKPSTPDPDRHHAVHHK